MCACWEARRPSHWGSVLSLLARCINLILNRGCVQINQKIKAKPKMAEIYACGPNKPTCYLLTVSCGCTAGGKPDDTCTITAANQNGIALPAITPFTIRAGSTADITIPCGWAPKVTATCGYDLVSRGLPLQLGQRSRCTGC